MQRTGLDYTQQRKQVSQLYIAVLTKKLTVREALNSFPQDCEDKTVIAAWHALCHLEADEDIRAKDGLYKKEQDDYIDYIAFTLDKGEALPENIISSYIPYHENALTANTFTIKGIIQNIKKFLT